MMLQGGIAADSGDADAPASASAAAAAAELAAAAGGFSEEERSRIEEGGRNSGGNRWPRQETLALLKIRSDMDVVFRDSSLKGPLWDEVSRKLGELGYHRSAKKCKEKFENVYKYHKRTKEGRTSKADGKTYRFFDQLQALETNPAGGGGGTSHHHQPPPPPLSLPPPPLSKPPAMLNTASTQIPAGGTTTTVPSPINITHQNNVDPISVAAPAVPMPINHHQLGGFPFSHPNMSASTNSTSSSTSSDEEPPERRRNRKRKWKDFFGRLMKEVIDKQEELQSKFLETLERRERDRMAREEAWRIQEIAKMKREHDLLVQERSMVAAKDAAVITFLQKITEQNPNAAAIPQISAMQLLQQQQQQQQIQPPPPSQPMPPMQQQPLPPPQPSQHTVQTMTTVVPVPNVPVSNVPVPTVPVSSPAPAVRNLDNGGGGGGENILQPSPSRWPKAEINALIKLRTTLDTKYQESGPKGPLWEEISSAMRKLGYNRNAKRCKEKWENINKYYKKVKESSKKRPEDSKTCPYFHQLDAIYREKAGSSSGNNPGFTVKPETQMAPIMARPEQQWPLPAAVQPVQPPQQSRTNNESTDQQNADQNEDDYDDDEDDEEEEEEGGEYEIVPNKTSSMAAVE